MAGVTNYQQQGAKQNTGDQLALFLKVFSGEVLTAFTRASKVMNNHMIKTIDSGKSTSFPVMGRGKAHYLPAGSNLDDLREAIPHNEVVINIDGLLTSDVLITDIFEAMNHYDVRGEYAKQLGEALAIAADGATVAEIAKLVKANTENITGLGKGIVVEKTITGGAGINYETGKAVIDGLLEMKAKWTTQYVPEEERFAYITPEVESAIITSKDAINRDYGAVASIVDGNIDKLCGFKIIAVPHLKAGGADKTGMLGTSPEGHEFPTDYAGALAVCAHRTAVATVKLKDLQLEHARRPELQADMIIAKNAVGHGGLRPEASGIILAK
ncbi:phage capsid protein [Veillonella atypica]|jgi:major capsid protein 10A|uniref:Phage capsid protein n=1 Tax=Veillonella atypica TaxID=39777 RepID=A0A3A6WKB7_9FIRM|nr:phage capsid protein [Veillonella atypica]RJY49970.1 phage capsid protein [Veillonella atypica]DAH88610.1 MAG TPA: major capsid protein [Caudoviricetes sp.]